MSEHTSNAVAILIGLLLGWLIALAIEHCYR